MDGIADEIDKKISDVNDKVSWADEILCDIASDLENFATELPESKEGDDIATELDSLSQGLRDIGAQMLSCMNDADSFISDAKSLVGSDSR